MITKTWSLVAISREKKNNMPIDNNHAKQGR